MGRGRGSSSGGRRGSSSSARPRRPQGCGGRWQRWPPAAVALERMQPLRRQAQPLRRRACRRACRRAFRRAAAPQRTMLSRRHRWPCAFRHRRCHSREAGRRGQRRRTSLMSDTRTAPSPRRDILHARCVLTLHSPFATACSLRVYPSRPLCLPLATVLLHSLITHTYSYLHRRHHHLTPTAPPPTCPFAV